MTYPGADWEDRAAPEPLQKSSCGVGQIAGLNARSNRSTDCWRVNDNLRIDRGTTDPISWHLTVIDETIQREGTGSGNQDHCLPVAAQAALRGKVPARARGYLHPAQRTSGETSQPRRPDVV